MQRPAAHKPATRRKLRVPNEALALVKRIGIPENLQSAHAKLTAFSWASENPEIIEARRRQSVKELIEDFGPHFRNLSHDGQFQMVHSARDEPILPSDDAHYFHQISHIYRGIIRERPETAPRLSKDLTKSQLLQRMNTVLKQSGAPPLRAREVKLLLIGSHAPVTSMPASPKLIMKRLTEVENAKDASGRPVMPFEAPGLLARINDFKHAVNKTGMPLTADSFVQDVEAIYGFHGPGTEMELRAAGSRWKFPKQFVADLMAHGLKPKRLPE
jgi:hypothetical protein